MESVDAIKITRESSREVVVTQLRAYLARRQAVIEKNPPGGIDLERDLETARAFRKWIGSAPDRFDEVDSLLDSKIDLISWLLEDLPWRLKEAGMLDAMTAHAHSYAEVTTPDNFLGDLALHLAEAGRVDEALAQSQANLERFPDDPWTVIRAADVHRMRHEYEAAETAYYRALSMAADSGYDRDGVLERLIPMLDELGRAADADRLIEEQRRRRDEEEERRAASLRSTNTRDVKPTFLSPPETIKHADPKTGRNAACPCGSGKKFKWCCGR